MIDQTDFNKTFGIYWKDRLPLSMLPFILIAFIIVFGLIISIANLDYDGYEIRHQAYIYEQYKRLVSDIIVYNDIVPEDDISVRGNSESLIKTQGLSRIVTADEREIHRKGIDRIMAQSGIFNQNINEGGNIGIPNLDDAAGSSILDNEMVIEINRKSGYSRIHGGVRKFVSNYNSGNDAGSVTSNYNYVIQRQGHAYINLTPELEQTNEMEFGYRDPEEIQRVVTKHKPMIEYCFKKGINHNAGMRGYVRVQFNISFNGSVISESIRILNSSINDRSVEQCIKNYIKRWRNFEVLDESMGIARVTQKFIFN